MTKLILKLNNNYKADIVSPVSQEIEKATKPKEYDSESKLWEPHSIEPIADAEELVDNLIADVLDKIEEKIFDALDLPSLKKTEKINKSFADDFRETFKKEHGIELSDNFDKETAKKLYEALEDIPKNFLKGKVERVILDERMGKSKRLYPNHGKYIEEEKKIMLNPDIFNLKTRYEDGEGHSISKVTQVVIHEIAHAIDDKNGFSDKKEWISISGWKFIGDNETPKGYKRLIIREEGAPKLKSNWAFKEDANFVRWYATRNPKEDFTESFSFAVTGLIGRFHGVTGRKKLDFIKKNILDKEELIKALPGEGSAPIDKPIVAPGVSLPSAKVPPPTTGGIDPRVGRMKPGHKYIERKGTPGNYIYIYADELNQNYESNIPLHNPPEWDNEQFIIDKFNNMSRDEKITLIQENIQDFNQQKMWINNLDNLGYNSFKDFMLRDMKHQGILPGKFDWDNEYIRHHHEAHIQHKQIIEEGKRLNELMAEKPPESPVEVADEPSEQQIQREEPSTPSDVQKDEPKKEETVEMPSDVYYTPEKLKKPVEEELKEEPKAEEPKAEEKPKEEPKEEPKAEEKPVVKPLTPKEAKEMGKEAFKYGKIRAPAQNKELMDRLEHGEPGVNIANMKAWVEGWDEANLKAPVPEPKAEEPKAEEPKPGEAPKVEEPKAEEKPADKFGEYTQQVQKHAVEQKDFVDFMIKSQSWHIVRTKKGFAIRKIGNNMINIGKPKMGEYFNTKEEARGWIDKFGRENKIGLKTLLDKAGLKEATAYELWQKLKEQAGQAPEAKAGAGTPAEEAKIEAPKEEEPKAEEKKKGMNEQEQLDYAKYVLENNPLHEHEIKRMAGLEGANPHGIPDDVWKRALKEIGGKIYVYDKGNVQVTPEGEIIGEKKVEEPKVEVPKPAEKPKVKIPKAEEKKPAKKVKEIPLPVKQIEKKAEVKEPVEVGGMKVEEDAKTLYDAWKKKIDDAELHPGRKVKDEVLKEFAEKIAGEDKSKIIKTHHLAEAFQIERMKHEDIRMGADAVRGKMLVEKLIRDKGKTYVPGFEIYERLKELGIEKHKHLGIKEDAYNLAKDVQQKVEDNFDEDGKGLLKSALDKNMFNLPGEEEKYGEKAQLYNAEKIGRVKRVLELAEKIRDLNKAKKIGSTEIGEAMMHIGGIEGKAYDLHHHYDEEQQKNQIARMNDIYGKEKVDKALKEGRDERVSGYKKQFKSLVEEAKKHKDYESFKKANEKNIFYRDTNRGMDRAFAHEPTNKTEFLTTKKISKHDQAVYLNPKNIFDTRNEEHKKLIKEFNEHAKNQNYYDYENYKGLRINPYGHLRTGGFDKEHAGWHIEDMIKNVHKDKGFAGYSFAQEDSPENMVALIHRHGEVALPEYGLKELYEHAHEGEAKVETPKEKIPEKVAEEKMPEAPKGMKGLKGAGADVFQAIKEGGVPGMKEAGIKKVEAKKPAPKGKEVAVDDKAQRKNFADQYFEGKIKNEEDLKHAIGKREVLKNINQVLTQAEEAGADDIKLVGKKGGGGHVEYKGNMLGKEYQTDAMLNAVYNNVVALKKAKIKNLVEFVEHVNKGLAKSIIEDLIKAGEIPIPTPKLGGSAPQKTPILPGTRQPSKLKGQMRPGHKYIRREGQPGSYVYYYRDPQGNLYTSDKPLHDEGKHKPLFGGAGHEKEHRHLQDDVWAKHKEAGKLESDVVKKYEIHALNEEAKAGNLLFLRSNKTPFGDIYFYADKTNGMIHAISTPGGLEAMKNVLPVYGHNQAELRLKDEVWAEFEKNGVADLDHVEKWKKWREHERKKAGRSDYYQYGQAKEQEKPEATNLVEKLGKMAEAQRKVSEPAGVGKGMAPQLDPTRTIMPGEVHIDPEHHHTKRNDIEKMMSPAKDGKYKYVGLMKDEGGREGINLVAKVKIDGDGWGVLKPLDGESHKGGMIFHNIPSGTQGFREVFAYELSKLFGSDLVPPTILVPVTKEVADKHKGLKEGGMASLQHFLDLGANKQDYDMGGLMGEKGQLNRNKQMHNLALLDAILGNADRHGGNIMMDKRNGNIFAIDNGLLGAKAYYMNTRSLDYAYSHSLDRLDNEDMERLEKLAQNFDKVKDMIMNSGMHSDKDMLTLQAEMMENRIATMLNDGKIPSGTRIEQIDNMYYKKYKDEERAKVKAIEKEGEKKQRVRERKFMKDLAGEGGAMKIITPSDPMHIKAQDLDLKQLEIHAKQIKMNPRYKKLGFDEKVEKLKRLLDDNQSKKFDKFKEAVVNSKFKLHEQWKAREDFVNALDYRQVNRFFDLGLHKGAIGAMMMAKKLKFDEMDKEHRKFLNPFQQHQLDDFMRVSDRDIRINEGARMIDIMTNHQIDNFLNLHAGNVGKELKEYYHKQDVDPANRYWRRLDNGDAIRREFRKDWGNAKDFTEQQKVMDKLSKHITTTDLLNMLNLKIVDGVKKQMIVNILDRRGLAYRPAQEETLKAGV